MTPEATTLTADEVRAIAEAVVYLLGICGAYKVLRSAFR